jgi:hypothetical protein
MSSMTSSAMGIPTVAETTTLECSQPPAATRAKLAERSSVGGDAESGQRFGALTLYHFRIIGELLLGTPATASAELGSELVAWYWDLKGHELTVLRKRHLTLLTEMDMECLQRWCLRELLTWDAWHVHTCIECAGQHSHSAALFSHGVWLDMAVFAVGHGSSSQIKRAY